MLSAGLASLGEDLLHHRCWAWGADVRCAEGNLLLRYGFERAALEARRYVLQWGDRLIVLWPFGLAVAKPSRAEALAIFAGRFSFEPKCITPSSAANAWSSACLEAVAPHSTDEPAALDVTLAAVQWIEVYERWICRVAGRAYRDRTLLTWDRATLCGGELRRGWKVFAREFAIEVSRTTNNPYGTPSALVRCLHG